MNYRLCRCRRERPARASLFPAFSPWIFSSALLHPRDARACILLIRLFYRPRNLLKTLALQGPYWCRQSILGNGTLVPAYWPSIPLPSGVGQARIGIKAFPKGHAKIVWNSSRAASSQQKSFRQSRLGRYQGARCPRAPGGLFQTARNRSHRDDRECGRTAATSKA